MTDNKTITTGSLVETWIKGWALVRGVTAPVKDSGGFRVDVGWPDQLKRYVFSEVNAGFLHLAHTISDPWIFLKVCAPPEVIKPLLPPRWSIRPVGFMMTCNRPVAATKPLLPQGYRLEVENKGAKVIARVFAEGSEPAAIGRMVCVDGCAIYDRIETQLARRRKGLASSVLYALEAIAVANGVTKGVLVATAEGKALYEKLGWQVHSLYTSAVILNTPDDLCQLPA